jgi:diguanylate cyclase (GGDEF)-like protein/PAS domain S-box-containing protein
VDENFYKQLIEDSPIGYAYNKIICDGGIPCDYEILDVNKAFEKLTGLLRLNIIGKRITSVLLNFKETEFEWIKIYGNIAINGGKKEFELFSNYFNKMFRVNVYSPKKGFFITHFVDISKEREQLLELEESRKRMENILEGTNVGTWELNMKTGEILHNERWAEMLGYTLEELSPITNDTWKKLVHPDDLIQEYIRDIQLYNKEIEYYDDEYRMKHKNGSWVWIHDRGKVISWANDGQPHIICGTHTDISEKKKKQEEVLYLSYCDQLTGLYNRRFYEEELKKLDIKENLPMTIVMADVNGLKLINDSFGHALGDELLIKIAEVLKRGCHKDDIVARLGGDEFVVILTNTDSRKAEQIIKRINDLVLNEKIGSINISISFGYETKCFEDESIQDIFKNAEDHMYRHKLYERSSIRNQTIDLIMNTLYEKSNREMLHSIRVSEICETIAIKMNFSQDEINQIRIAGLMHDIGKMGIDENILNKTERLNRHEWKEIMKHPEIGYRILSSSNEFSEIAEYVLKHHERWDGTGYPRGFKGEEISLQSRIIAVADAFDAMTSDRAYRKGLTVEDATNELNKCSGTQFDPDIVKVFINMIM